MCVCCNFNYTCLSSLTTVQPFFRSKPQNVTAVPIGGTVMIHCDIGGRPRPRVIWVYGDLTAVRNESSRLMSFPNGTLLIRGVVEQDYGDYICHATEDLNVSHQIKLVQPTGNKEKKIGKLFLLSILMLNSLSNVKDQLH